MTSKSLLHNNVQKFIRDYRGTLSKLAFAGSPFKDISVQELIQQIDSRRRIEGKLPTWFSTAKIVYPPKLNLEQTSSEITAAYKASLVSGNTLADMTGGFGIDSYFFSKKFKTVFHFELNRELSQMAEHNFNILEVQNVQFINGDGLENVCNNYYDVIFSDPSRRNDSKGKVFFLNDCQPNIPQNIYSILAHCNTFLLKTSPMLDISVGVNELYGVSEIHVVAVENEVKELLWLLNKEDEKALTIKTVNFNKTRIETFNFSWRDKADAVYSLPKKYLYEPNAAILKSGGFDVLSERLNVSKLHKNTHLYTSDDLMEFPGRRFYIERVIPYTKSNIRAELNLNKANIAIRNFPESVATLRKKWKLSEGGDSYLFFITNLENQKEILVCTKN